MIHIVFYGIFIDYDLSGATGQPIEEGKTFTETQQHTKEDAVENEMVILPPLMEPENGKKEEGKATPAEEGKGDADEEREEASKAEEMVENPFFNGLDEEGDNDSKMDGAVGESKGLIIKKEAEDQEAKEEAEESKEREEEERTRKEHEEEERRAREKREAERKLKEEQEAKQRAEEEAERQAREREVAEKEAREKEKREKEALEQAKAKEAEEKARAEALRKAKEEEKLELNKWRPEEVQILPRSRAELFPSTMLLASPMHTWLASSKAEAGKETEDKKEEEAMDTSSNMESATTSIKKELTLDEE